MKKKICFVVSSVFTASAFLKNHISELSKIYDVYLVANLTGESGSDSAEFNIIEIKHIPIERRIKPVEDLKAVIKLSNYLRENKFAAVQTVTPKAGLIGMLSSRIAGSQNRIHIFTGQVWYTKTGFLKRILRFADRLIVRLSSHILVDGRSQREFLINEGIINKKNSKVLGRGSISGVNESRFIPDPELKKEIRQKLNISDNELVFMFLGRINRDKGVPELIKAFEMLNDKRATLMLVGPDEENLESELSKYVSDKSKVIFYGKTKEPEKLLQVCDIFCLPSHREGFGTSVIEASLLEKPIICSDTYGLKETIIDDVTGIRHKVNDVESLYEAMNSLNNDKKKRTEMGKNGRRYVLENFSAAEITAEWINFYRSIL